ncbi:MAG: methyltransferase domain-containing protein [Brevundimonas sp.]
MAPDSEREKLAATFDTAAATYANARPTYPDALFDDLVATTGIRPGAHLLEVGSGPGIATAPLADRGFRITCLEPGPALAEAARTRLAGRDVDVVTTRFEDWQPTGTYALVYAATSWHWLDPDTRFARVAEVLETGGHLAFWTATHVIPYDGDPFFTELQDVYDAIGEGLPPGTPTPRPQELPDEGEAIEASGLFDVVAVRQYDWETVHDADSYLALLDTFSGHIAMQPWQRERLHGEIRARLAARPDGLLHRHWGCVLHVARLRA